MASLPPSQREHPDHLPPPYLWFHDSPQPPSSGRAPLRPPDSEALPPDSSSSSSSIPRMPTAEELAVSPIPDGFRCPLCLDVLDQPTTTVPCGHTFCERCILASLNNSEECLSPTSNTPSTRCPVCRSIIRKDRLGPCWIVRDLIDSITVHCDYGVSYNVHTEVYEPGVTGGCNATFRLGDRSIHLQECGHVMVACSFERDGCQAMARRGLIRAHEQECIFRSDDCKCGQRIRTQIWEEHQEACPSVELRCPHQRHGCSHICMRGDLEEHLSSCPYEILKDLLEEKDRQYRELQRQNLHLESSLWTALKSRQQLEQEMADLRWRGGVGETVPEDVLETQGETKDDKNMLARSSSSSPVRSSLLKVIRSESLSGERGGGERQHSNGNSSHGTAEKNTASISSLSGNFSHVLATGRTPGIPGISGTGSTNVPIPSTLISTVDLVEGQFGSSIRNNFLVVDSIPPLRGAVQKVQNQLGGGGGGEVGINSVIGNGSSGSASSSRIPSIVSGLTIEGSSEKVHHAPPEREREKNGKVGSSNPRYHRAIHPV